MSRRRRKHPPQSESREQIRLHGGRYEKLELLSQRDRGRWLVRDFRPPPKGTRRLAIIVPFDEACQQLRRSLRRLPAHASSLPTLIDHGRLDGQYCFIVEWVPGIDLERYLERVGSGRTVRPSVTQCLRLFRGTVHSLRLMHDVSQLVHGDLKPANLVLTTHPSQLRLIDFGSSWQWDRSRHRVPGDGVDPVFSAPEVFLRDAPVEPSADQFSIGVLLYLMLTMRIPFYGFGGRIGHPEYRDSLRGSDLVPEPPSQLIQEPEKIPRSILAAMDDLVLRMLALEPRDRFPSSLAWSQAFDALHAKILQAAHAEPEGGNGGTTLWDTFSRACRTIFGEPPTKH
jgi:serine/threonine protein kinase